MFGGTTNWCGREWFCVGGLTTFGCGALEILEIRGGRRGGSGIGFAVGFLLADNPPYAGRLGGDFVSLDLLGVHIPYRSQRSPSVKPKDQRHEASK